MIVSTSRHRAGFSLLEMCAVMGTLGLTLSIGGVILITAMKATKVGSTSLLQIRLRSDVVDTVRTDIAAASAAPDQFETWTRSHSCLILERSADEHVIYEWQPGELMRIARTAAGESRSRLSIGIADIAIEFE